MNALRPALQGCGPAIQRTQDAVTDREVVVDDVELGQRARALRRREDHAVGVRHADLPPARVDDGVLWLCHEWGFSAKPRGPACLSPARTWVHGGSSRADGLRAA